MRTKVEKVTPAMAARWLAGMEDKPQRSIRRARVEKLIHAIETDQWRLTHQGIAIGSDGRVLDGMHRLHAIVATDQTVEVLVSRDTPSEIFDVVDTGAARTPADALRIAGYTDVNVLASAVRSVLSFQNFMGTTGEGWDRFDRGITSAEIVDWLDSDDVRRDKMLASVSTGRRVGGALARYGITTAVASADALFRLADGDVGETARAEFVERLCDGVMLGRSSPILALRRWIVSDTGYVHVPRMTRRPVTMCCYVKAVNDYALGIDRSLTIFRWQKEIIPVPLEKGARERISLEEEQRIADEEARELVDKSA